MGKIDVLRYETKNLFYVVSLLRWEWLLTHNPTKFQPSPLPPKAKTIIDGIQEFVEALENITSKKSVDAS
jgi:hypothetical protein